MTLKLCLDPFPIFKFDDEKLSSMYDLNFTTRKGGISTGPYTSMNLGSNTSDKQEFVEANTKKICKNLNIDNNKLVQLDQIHSSIIINADRQRNKNMEADGLITSLPGIPLMMRFADCYPLYLFSRNKRALGLIHCGWKGIYGDIVKKAVFSMKRNFEIDAEDLSAIIGPGICMNCFEVSKDLANDFMNHFTYLPEIKNNMEIWSTGGRINLKEIIREQLILLGLNNKYISSTDQCTKCNDNLFFSYRRDNGDTGRMAAIAMIIPEEK